MLQKLLLDPILLGSFKYYVNFRHTGCLESVNSMSLMYASKRCSFQNEAFTARKTLAAIDHNYHLDRDDARNQDGITIVSRKFNPRTKVWDQRMVKSNKKYGYIPLLRAMVLKKRKNNKTRVTAQLPRKSNDPRSIAPTIASVPAPNSRDIIRKSRFNKMNEDKYRNE
ncbi:hypothetical protein QZH41_012840 [Actinostola sp. cb2023]|nr:hypothetical protein QZH41_012840 [Actinostola sp. cb2023]